MIAISTAFPNALVGIDIAGIQDFASLEASAKQSENILKTIDDLLKRNDLTIKDNDAFGIVVGPGSFTGLRIGLALIKGFCAGLSKDCKVVPISSLDFMAFKYLKANNPKSNFVCVINALSGLYFICEYTSDGKKVGQERLIDSVELDSIKLLKVGLKGEGICEIEVVLTAEGLLQLANNLIKEDKQVDIKSLAPVYLRKSQAEVGLEQKNLKKS